MLGVVPDPRAVPVHGALRPGDALMLYTDGLVEAPGRDIDVGTDRLLGEASRLVASGFRNAATELVRVVQGRRRRRFRRLRAGAYLAHVSAWPG